MDGEVQLDLALYRSMVRATLGWRLWAFRVLGGLLVVGGLYALLTRASPGTGVLDLVLGVFFLGHDELVTRLGWRRLRTLTGAPWRYRVGEEGVTIHTPATDVDLKWDAITGVVHRPRAWALRTATRQRLAIPRAAFSESDASAIDQRFTAHTSGGGAAP